MVVENQRRFHWTGEGTKMRLVSKANEALTLENVLRVCELVHPARLCEELWAPMTQRSSELRNCGEVGRVLWIKNNVF